MTFNLNLTLTQPLVITIKSEMTADQFTVITQKLDTIIMTQAELAAKLAALKAQNDKADAEQLAALKKLQDALAAAGGTTPEVDAALAELSTSIQRDDDENADAPAV
jgi:hypothetical protein